MPLLACQIPTLQILMNVHWERMTVMTMQFVLICLAHSTVAVKRATLGMVTHAKVTPLQLVYSSEQEKQ